MNRGEVWPISDDAAQPFTLPVVCGRAATARGVTAADVRRLLGDADVEALGRLLIDLEHHARLTVLGRWITHRFLDRLIGQRLALEQYARRDPGVEDEPIVEPWFITGAPRSGTTVLHGLLAQDPRHRVPEGWELLRPVPPPALSDNVEARIALADAELRTPQVVASGLSSIHEYSGRMPKECLSAMSLCFRSEEFVARYHLPGYAAWLQRCDMTPAYLMHRRVLQVLQRGAPARRWVLKSPVHLHSLPVLQAVYPDATISFTHREPLDVLASVTSLVATMRSAHSDVVDVPAVARYHADLYARSLDRLVDADLGDATRVSHTAHRDLLAGGVDVVAGLYRRFGWELPGPTAEAMSHYLHHQPQARPGVHQYDEVAAQIVPGDHVHHWSRYRTRFLGAPVGE